MRSSRIESSLRLIAVMRPARMLPHTNGSYVLHVAIDIHGQRIRRERRIVVDALFEELPPGRVVHDPLLVEGAVEIGVRPLDDTLPSGQPSHLAA